MYCPKCTKEIQHTTDLTCPYCAAALVDRPPLSDNTPADSSDNHVHAVFEADEIMHDGTLPADSTSMQPASQENIFFLADEVDDAADKKIDYDDPRRITSASQDSSEQGMTLDAVFRQILDAKTAASEDIPAEPAGGSHVSNAASGTHQDHSRELLDKAFEEINTDDRRATASGTKSLAITMLLGTLVLVCVIGAGIYYLKHTPARETAMQMPVKVLSLPASDAPAPTLKSSGATEQKSPGVTARPHRMVWRRHRNLQSLQHLFKGLFVIHLRAAAYKICRGARLSRLSHQRQVCLKKVRLYPVSSHQ